MHQIYSFVAHIRKYLFYFFAMSSKKSWFAKNKQSRPNTFPNSPPDQAASPQNERISVSWGHARKRGSTKRKSHREDVREETRASTIFRDFQMVAEDADANVVSEVYGSFQADGPCVWAFLDKALACPCRVSSSCHPSGADLS